MLDTCILRFLWWRLWLAVLCELHLADDPLLHPRLLGPLHHRHHRLELVIIHAAGWFLPRLAVNWFAPRSTVLAVWLTLASASLLLVGLVFCLFSIGGYGLPPPCYWLVWASASMLSVGLSFCLHAIGWSGLLPLCYRWIWASASMLLAGLSFCLHAISWSGHPLYMETMSK